MFSSKNPNYMKLRTNLKLCINRFKLLEKKKTELALKARREISDYIVAGKDDRARIRVEHIIREDYLVEAMEICEMFCDLLQARFGIIQRMKELDPGIEEAIGTLIWVAPRMISDVPELKEVSLQLTNKYGKEFAEKCKRNELGNVNEKVYHKLTMVAPPKILVERYLIEIARTYNVPFTPDPSVMMEEGQIPENFTDDLIDLDGSNSSGKGGGGGDIFPGGGSGGGGGGGHFLLPSAPQGLPSAPQGLPTVPGYPDTMPAASVPPTSGGPSPFQYPQPAGSVPGKVPPPLPAQPPNAGVAGPQTKTGLEPGMNSPFRGSSPTNLGGVSSQPFQNADGQADLLPGGGLPSLPTYDEAVTHPPGGNPYPGVVGHGMPNVPPQEQLYPNHPVNPNPPGGASNGPAPQDPALNGHSPHRSGSQYSTTGGAPVPVLPDLPDLPNLPSIPVGHDSVNAGGDDIDFDDLTRRFENLKKHK